MAGNPYLLEIENRRLKAVIAELEAELADAKIHEMAVRKFTQQQMLDFATIALGRMGYGELRLTRDFEAKLTEVAREYGDLILESKKSDEELWEFKAKLDRELARYTGSRFEPYEKRYYGEVANDT